MKLCGRFNGIRVNTGSPGLQPIREGTRKACRRTDVLSSSFCTSSGGAATVVNAMEAYHALPLEVHALQDYHAKA